MCSLPFGIRCSPWKNPLSDVKMISVLLSSPVALSASTTFLTPSSTDSSDSSSQRYLRWMSAISPAVKSGRFRIAAGLSETSASLKFGGLGSGSGAEAGGWGGGGLAGPAQVEGGVGVGSGAPMWGAV